MAETPFTLKQLLQNFILIERMQYDIHDNNRFAFSFGKIQRSHEFLLVLTERYLKLTEEYAQLEGEKHLCSSILMGTKPRGSFQPLDREQQIDRRLREVGTELQLEIETFYSNGKILLDHIAHTIYYFFGQAQRCRLESHRAFLECIDLYVEQKSLQLPDNFRKLAEELRERVSQFRDKLITHDMSPNRMHGISYVTGGRPIIVSSKIDGKEEDFFASEPLEVLLRDMEGYILLFLHLIKTNEEKTKLPPNPDRDKWPHPKIGIINNHG